MHQIRAFMQHRHRNASAAEERHVVIETYRYLIHDINFCVCLVFAASSMI